MISLYLNKELTNVVEEKMEKADPVKDVKQRMQMLHSVRMT